MVKSESVRRRLLKEAVRENIETIRGLSPRPLRRSHRIRRTFLRGVRLVVVPGLLLLSTTALSTGGGERQVVAMAPAPAPPPETSAPERSFAPPRRVNLAAFPLGVKKIVLDPGHGGADSGARTASGIWEKEVTLDIAARLRALLREASFEVVMTREQDETISLRQRAQIANTERGDLFVSIHVNSIPLQEHRSVETYFLGPTDDPRVERTAGLENRGSGYSLADFRRLLDGVYTHLRQGESKKLAGEVHRELVAALSKANPALKDDGMKSAPFLVLVATEMPGVLAEVSCLSNKEEARLLADPGYRQHIARGLYAGIRAYADARNRLGGEGSL